MALGTVTYLNTGATSLAAANWSDTTGVVDSAYCVISSGVQSIQTNLTFSLANGVGIFDVLEGFSGDIGGSGGSLTFETEAALYSEVTNVARVRYWASGGSFYYTAQGAGAAGNVCHIFQQKGGGRAFLTGTYTQRSILLESGSLNIAENVASEAAGTPAEPTSNARYQWHLAGGAATIQYSATGLHRLRVTGGTHTLGRGVQTGCYVNSGSVTVDAQGGAVALLETNGGNVSYIASGTITNLFANAGNIDFSGLTRPLIVTNLYDSPGCTIKPSKLLTITNRYPAGSGARGLT